MLRDPVGIRTQDPQLRRLLLYPAELPDHYFAAAKIRLFFNVWVFLNEKNQITLGNPASEGRKDDADASV